MKYIKLFSIMLAFAIIGCARSSHTLTLAVGGAPYEMDYWVSLIKKFEDSTHIKVTILRQPTNTDQRRQGLVTPLRAHKGDPDVFLMDIAWISQFASSDWLLPLDNYAKEDSFDIGKFITPVVNQVDIYNGKLIALPVYVDGGVLYYRKDLLSRYGCEVPDTWNELLKCALYVQKQERKHNPNFYGFVWQGAQYEGLICDFLEFAVSNGCSISDSGHITVDKPQCIGALGFMMDLIQRYKVSPPNTYTEMKEEEARLYFENGNALFERNWPYAYALHERKGSPVSGKVGIAVLPEFKGERHASTLGGWHIGISKFSDRKADAWKLVKFILSYNTQKDLALKLGWNPGRKDVYDDREVLADMHQMPVLKMALQYAVARPQVPYYTQISAIMQKYVNAALAGKMEPGAALENAQREINRLIQTYNE